jgi:arsenite methyltransferase
MSDPRDPVRENYARRARTARAPESGARSTPELEGGSTTVLDRAVERSSSLVVGYSAEDLEAVPEGADMGLSCGTPLRAADLKPGETVLDLGSGGGLDCFLAAREVGPAGRVIGVDMTPEMVSRARAAAKKAGLAQVDFRLGEIENLPVGDGDVDVVISNCVINLSPDKQRAYEECYRVLRPGGRVAFSDVVEIAAMPDAMREDALLMSCCVGGAKGPDAVRAMLKGAGFEGIDIQVKGESRDFIKDWVPGSRAEDYVASAQIVAVKPVNGPARSPPRERAPCCG